jgi:hypothetical protein
VATEVRTGLGTRPTKRVANITGSPAMSVPLWWNTSGQPIGGDCNFNGSVALSVVTVRDLN